MSQTKSLGAPKASFDRRSVVKTAAWSVPVIAAAIAAPAAAASQHTGTVTATLTLGTPVFLGSPQKSGTGPTGFTVTNTTTAAVSLASVVVTITALAGSTHRIGIRTFSGGTISGVESWTTANVYTVTYNINSGVPAGSSASFNFVYDHETKNKDTAGYVMDIRVLRTPGEALTASAELTLLSSNA